MINHSMYKLGSQPSAIRQLFMYGLERKREIGEDKVFDFSLGSPSISAPIEVQNKFKSIIEDNDYVPLHAYSATAGLIDVRQSIAQFFSERHKSNFNANGVFMTCGAAPALTASLKAVCNPNSEVIVVAPYFPEYKVFIENANAKMVEVMSNLNNFTLDIDAISNAINENTAAIIVNSPNNPTGVVYPKTQLIALADVLRQAQAKYNHDIYLISDEPYSSIVYKEDIPFIPDLYNNTILCNSASKSLSLPGERIGYTLVSDSANNFEQLMLSIAGASRSLGHVCAPVLFQRLLKECIGIKPDVEAYKKNRDLLYRIVQSFGFECVCPDGAFYLWVKSPMPDAKEFSDIAKKHELLIVPSDSFGIKGWARLGYCVSYKTILNSSSAFEKLSKELSMIK